MTRRFDDGWWHIAAAAVVTVLGIAVDVAFYRLTHRTPRRTP